MLNNMVEHWGKQGVMQPDKKYRRKGFTSRIHKVVLYCLSHNKTNLAGMKKTDSDEVSTRCLGLGKGLFK